MNRMLVFSKMAKMLFWARLFCSSNNQRLPDDWKALLFGWFCIFWWFVIWAILNDQIRRVDPRNCLWMGDRLIDYRNWVIRLDVAFGRSADRLCTATNGRWQIDWFASFLMGFVWTEEERRHEDVWVVKSGIWRELLRTNREPTIPNQSTSALNSNRFNDW